MAEPTGFMKILTDIDNNKNVALGLSIFFVVYTAVMVPMLPNYALSIFDNSIFRLLALLVIAYTASKNPVLAILGSIAMVVSIITFQTRKNTVHVPVPVQVDTPLDLEGVEDEDYDYEGEVPAPQIPGGPQAMSVGNGTMGSPDGNGSIPVGPNGYSTVAPVNGSLENTGMLGYDKPRPDREGQGGPTDDLSDAGCPGMSGFKSAGWPQYASMDAGFYETRKAGTSVPGYNITDERFKYTGV